MKAMNSWIKDFAEVERTHGKALDKLALLATTTIVNKLNDNDENETNTPGSGSSGSGALPTTLPSSYEGIQPKVPSRNPHLPPTSSGRADEPRYYDEV